MNNREELSALAALIAPMVLEQLQSHSQGVSEIEAATSLEGVNSLPAQMRIGGVEKIVEVPISLLAAGTDQVIADCKKVLEQAATAAENMEALMHNLPKIVDGVWYIFDPVTGEYESTGITAQGLSGEKGDTGEPFTYSDFTPEQLESLKVKGDPFTFADFTPAQLEAIRGFKGDPFTFTDFTPEQLESLKIKGDTGIQGEGGKSAYEIACEKGFVGTETEWLNSLKGEKGDGLDYSTMTPEEIANITGKDGKDGRDGIDGINGQDGKDGIDGQDGIDGVNGQDGKDGIDGQDGKDGINGADFEYADFTPEQIEGLRPKFSSLSVAAVGGIVTIPSISPDSIYRVSGSATKIMITGKAANWTSDSSAVICLNWGAALDAIAIDYSGSGITAFDEAQAVANGYSEISIFNNKARLSNGL